MAHAKNPRRGAAAPSGTDGDGQAGVPATGTAPDAEGAGANDMVRADVMRWADVQRIADAAEAAEGGHGRRIVRVFCEDHKAPELMQGTYGCAPVEHGPAAIQFSDGETVTL